MRAAYERRVRISRSGMSSLTSFCIRENNLFWRVSVVLQPTTSSTRTQSNLPSIILLDYLRFGSHYLDQPYTRRRVQTFHSMPSSAPAPKWRRALASTRPALRRFGRGMHRRYSSLRRSLARTTGPHLVYFVRLSSP